MCKQRKAQYGCRHVLTGRVMDCTTAKQQDRLCKKIKIEICQVRQKCPRCKTGLPPRTQEEEESLHSSSFNATETGTTGSTSNTTTNDTINL
jgi:hypothetical protein